ncbi:MAG: hypothetical protein WAO45_06980 [Tissierellaceae bacterium]
MKSKKLIVFLIMILLISGCRGNGNKKQEIKTLDKAPDSLTDIDKGISAILEKVGRIERINLDIDQEDAGKKDQSEDNMDSESKEVEAEENVIENQDDGNMEDEHGGKSNGSGDDKKPPKEEKDEQIRKVWKEINGDLDRVYSKLSDYEAEGLKKGASKDSLTKLQKAVNQLAKSIEVQDILSIYNYGSQSLSNLKPLYNLYKDDYRGEVCDIKSSVYQYYIKAIVKDIVGARTQIQSKEDSINKIRQLIGDDKEKNKELDRVKISLENLGISLEEGSKRVLILEKDTLINSLKALE